MFLTEYNEQLHIENEKKIASEEAIKKGEIIGEDRFAKLSAALLEVNRLDDLKKAVSDISYRENLYKEFKL